MKKIIFLYILSMLLNGCGSVKEKDSLKIGNGINIDCNGTKVLILDKSITINKDKSNFLMKVILDNTKSEKRNDIFFHFVFLGGDVGQSLIYSPTFTRIQPKGKKSINIVFNSYKGKLPQPYQNTDYLSLRLVGEISCKDNKNISSSKRVQR